MGTDIGDGGVELVEGLVHVLGHCCDVELACATLCAVVPHVGKVRGIDLVDWVECIRDDEGDVREITHQLLCMLTSCMDTGIHRTGGREG